MMVVDPVPETDDGPRAPGPVIDVCGIYFDADGWEAYLRLFAERAPGYLRAFAHTLTARARVLPSEYYAALAIGPHNAVDVLVAGGPMDLPVDAHGVSLQAAGITRQVIHGVPRDLADGTNVNTRLAGLASQHPDVLEVWAGLDLTDADAAIIELERCVFEFGLRGASIVHWWGDRSPRDADCHAVYARAEELGVPLWIHTGVSYASNQPLDCCTWSDIDHIAVVHPELTIVVGHGGWPWVLDGMAVLQRHPNVFLDFSAHRPRHMARPGSGWEPMLHYGRSVVRDRIVFGSVTWIHSASIGELATEVPALGLGDGVARAWLHDNARRLLDGRRAVDEVEQLDFRGVSVTG